MEKVHPEEIVQILKGHGTEVSIDQAKHVLEFMYLIANMALDIYSDAPGCNKPFTADSGTEIIYSFI